MAKPFDRSWSEYAGRYSQNEPEDADSFDRNFANIFGKSRLELLKERQAQERQAAETQNNK